MLKIINKTSSCIKILLMLAILFMCSYSYAQNKPDNKENRIDTNDFYNSKHHWYDIYEAKNVINPEPNQPRYEPTQIKEIADNILLYQRDNGGWPKNYDMQAILTKEQKDKVIEAKSVPYTTFDNCTTYSHIKYLAKACQITKVERYKDAALRGIDFVFSAQYPNGGWPQYFPLESKYSRHITFNDDVMVGIMEMLKDIIDNKPYYSFVDSARRQKAKFAFEKGLDCILKCQINDNGKLTGWCQQHDANDLRPAWARAYEPPSICNREGTGVVLFLMSIDKPGKEVINSVQSAVKWFEDSKILGIRVEEFNTPPFQTPLRLLKTDRRVVEDKTAPPIWARFYELGTHRPLFSNRQSQLLYSMAEVDRERRAYGWYTYDPQQVLDKYPAWQAEWAPAQNVLIVSAVDVYDGFELPELSGVWDTSKFVTGTVKIQSEFVRAGKRAAKITIHQGDHSEPGGLERSELMEPKDLEAIEGRGYTYSFSMFIPKDFPIVPTRLVIAQWKQRCPQADCEPNSPLIAVRYINGELQVTHLIGSEKTILYTTKEDVRNKWLDFRFQIRFSTNQNGQVKAWLNDKKICDYKGINAFPENAESGYPSPSRFYFKMGLYRDRTAEPMTIYIDEYRKKELPENSI